MLLAVLLALATACQRHPGSSIFIDVPPEVVEELRRYSDQAVLHVRLKVLDREELEERIADRGLRPQDYPAWKLEATSLFSSGLLLYILFTIPLSQVIVNIWKYISFTKRLRALDAKEEAEVTL